MTVPLVVRTRWPGACLLIVGSAFALHQALAFPPTSGTVGLYAALYAVGAHQARLRRTTCIAATTAYVVLAVVLHLLGSPRQIPDFLAFYLVLAVAWTAGAGVRRWRADEVERRRLSAEVAVVAERARLARELHDVVTHHVTAMVVQADAAQYLLPGAPGRAGESLTAISGTGRRALTELRSLLGVLEATGAPGPGTGNPAKILVVTTFNVDEYVYEALRAGASGFLLKDAHPAELINAVRTVAAGDSLLAPAVTRALIGHYAERIRPASPSGDRVVDVLTRRELEVLRQLAAGLSNAEIAAALFITPETVKTYVSRILTKLDLRDRVQAVVLAYRIGLVSHSP
nr:LuxR C-terminal-related transcriptional regulator [Herbidospora yilanensis]